MQKEYLMENMLLEYPSERELYLSYMPFLKNGGVFVRTTELLELGTQVKLQVTLPDALESSEVIGKVCWVTPPGAQNGTPAGLGVAFEEDPDNIRGQIETAIGRLLNSSDPTLSM